MYNAMKLVGMTYVWRMLSSWALWVIVLASAAIPILLLANLDPRHQDFLPLIIAWVSAFLSGIWSGLVAAQMREQFTNERARTLPGYRWAHLWVAVGLTILAVLGVPLGLAWASGVWPVGTVAWSCCAGAMLWWYIMPLSSWMQLPMTMFWFLPYSQKVREAMIWITTGTDPRFAWGLMGLGVIGIATALWRTATLNEEMPAYHRRIGKQVGLTGNTRAGLGWVYRSNERQLAKAERAVGRTGLWARSRRWEMSFAPVQNAWIFAVMGAGWYLMLAWIGRWHSPDQGQVIAWPTMVTLITGFFPWGRDVRNKPSREMMLPVERRELFLEMGMALCRRMIRMWGIIVSGIFCAAIAIDPEIPTGRWAMMIALSLGTQLLLIGVLLESLRHTEGRRMLLMLTTAIVLIAVSMGLVQEAGIFVVCPAAAAMAGLGWMIAVVARRNWLRTDLG